MALVWIFFRQSVLLPITDDLLVLGSGWNVIKSSGRSNNKLMAHVARR